MNTYSFWERDVWTQESDVSIIGGGFVGSFTALFLAKLRPDLRIVVYDQRLGTGGASSRNAGFACFGSLSEIIATARYHDMDAVKEIVQKRYLGLEIMRNTLGDQHMDYTPCGGYELFTSEDKEVYQQCMELLPEFNTFCNNSMGLVDTYVTSSESLKTLDLEQFDYAIYNQYEGSIHPGKALRRLHSLCREVGVEFVDRAYISGLQSESTGVKFKINEASNGWAKKVIIATNGFTLDLIRDKIDLRPARNMVLVTRPIPELKLKSTCHYKEGYVYFRNVGNRVLLGGGRHIDLDGEQTSDFGINPKIKSYLTQFLLNKILPGYDEDIIDTWWSGIMGVGEQLEVDISWLSQHILTGIRLNGMGVALSSLVGKELSDKMNSCF